MSVAPTRQYDGNLGAGHTALTSSATERAGPCRTGTRAGTRGRRSARQPRPSPRQWARGWNRRTTVDVGKWGVVSRSAGGGTGAARAKADGGGASAARAKTDGGSVETRLPDSLRSVEEEPAMLGA